jgi:hypothetical protein
MLHCMLHTYTIVAQIDVLEPCDYLLAISCSLCTAVGGNGGERLVALSFIHSGATQSV